MTAIGKRLVPVWHEVTATDVASFSPILADKLAVRTEIGIENVGKQIAGLCPEILTTDSVEVTNSEWIVSLQNQLKCEDEMSRLNAAWALAQSGHRAKPLCEDLCYVLEHDEWMIAQAAAAALGEIDCPSEKVIESLCVALVSDSWMVRRVAAWSLGQLGASNDTAKSNLRSALEDEHEEVRQAASDGLRAIMTTGTALLAPFNEINSDLETNAPLSERIVKLIEVIRAGITENPFFAWDIDKDEARFAALGEIGPSARTALSTLRTLRKESDCSEYLREEIDCAIAKIET